MSPSIRPLLVASTLLLVALVVVDGVSFHSQQISVRRRRAPVYGSALVQTAVARRAKRSIAPEPSGHDLVNMSEKLATEQANRRALRRKKKRLRELRKEIRQMNGVVASQRGTVGRRAGSASMGGLVHETWRRKVLSKMCAIVERLDRLEKQLDGGEKRGSNATNATVGTATTALPFLPSLTIAPTTRTRGRGGKHREPLFRRENKKLQKHLASVASSLKGENGTSCAAHGECKPGRCCHLSGVVTPDASKPEKAGTCTFHGLPVGVACVNSCQCSDGLICVGRKDNSTTPVCARASPTDIQTSYYLNTSTGIFPVEGPRMTI